MQREGQNTKGKKANLERKKSNWESDGKGKGFKTVVGDYSFMMWQSTWPRRTRLGIIFKIGLLYGIFFKKNAAFWVKALEYQQLK